MLLPLVFFVGPGYALAFVCSLLAFFVFIYLLFTEKKNIVNDESEQLRVLSYENVLFTPILIFEPFIYYNDPLVGLGDMYIRTRYLFYE